MAAQWWATVAGFRRRRLHVDGAGGGDDVDEAAVVAVAAVGRNCSAGWIAHRKDHRLCRKKRKSLAKRKNPASRQPKGGGTARTEEAMGRDWKPRPPQDCNEAEEESNTG